jgi:hypothetical protein
MYVKLSKGPEQEDQASDHHHPFFIITHHDVTSFTAGCDAQNWSHHQEPIPYCTRSDHMCGVLHSFTSDSFTSDSYPQVPEIENAGNSFRSAISERKSPSSDMLLEPLFGCSGRACFIQVAPSRRVALGLRSRIRVLRIRVLTNFQVYPCVWVPSGNLT